MSERGAHYPVWPNWCCVQCLREPTGSSTSSFQSPSLGTYYHVNLKMNTASIRVRRFFLFSNTDFIKFHFYSPGPGDFKTAVIFFLSCIFISDFRHQSLGSHVVKFRNNSRVTYQKTRIGTLKSNIESIFHKCWIMFDLQAKTVLFWNILNFTASCACSHTTIYEKKILLKLYYRGSQTLMSEIPKKYTTQKIR